MESTIAPSFTFKLHSYKTILLSDFIDISSNGEYAKLIITGQPDEDQLSKAWEEIVQENGRQNGDRSYDAYFQLLKSYTLLVASYTIVKASLFQLSFSSLDFATVLDLEKRGYKISVDTTDALARSINAALSKVTNLITKAMMKQKQMEDIVKGMERTKRVGFEEIIANLNVGLGFVVQDNVTLAQYNEYKKILKERNKPKYNVRTK